MRNVFDQYQQPENRLTHALASCLAEDPALCKNFVRWLLKDGPLPSGRLHVLEQQLPGDAPVGEDEAESRGLPDAWIHDGQSWAMLVESKVSSAIKGEQLRRHLATALKRGFEQIQVVLISVKRPGPLPRGVHPIEWRSVYTWAQRQAVKSSWAVRLVRYMEILETKMVADEYLKEGALTVFSGVPFTGENPYNYREAKRVLRLLMNALRERKELSSQLGIDRDAPGRTAITGRDGAYVWDFLRLKGTQNTPNVTKAPHSTLSIRADDVFALLTMPNNMAGTYRKRILGAGYDGFSDLMGRVAGEIVSRLKSCPGAIPWVEVVQRRYPHQRAVPIVDSRLEFDLRTAFPHQASAKSRPKTQAEWLRSAYAAYGGKRANVQLAVGAIFPYDRCPVVHTPEAVNAIIAAWLGCKPLLDALLKGQRR